MKLRFTMAIPVALLGLLAFASPAKAQRGIGAKPAPSGRVSPGESGGWAGGGAFHPARPHGLYFRGRGRGYGLGWGWGYLPFPYDYDYPGYAYTDYESEMTGTPERESLPPLVIAEPPPKEIRPVLLERQGDRWVQITGYSQSPAVAQPQAPEAGGVSHLRATLPSVNETAGPVVHELPPVVLVFRDGHKEEVRSYTIIGDVLYAKADYWTNGSWTRKIEIGSLDVPATLKLNDDRGSKFRLPSGPQEVMIRP